MCSGQFQSNICALVLLLLLMVCVSGQIDQLKTSHAKKNNLEILFFS